MQASYVGHSGEFEMKLGGTKFEATGLDAVEYGWEERAKLGNVEQVPAKSSI